MSQKHSGGKGMSKVRNALLIVLAALILLTAATLLIRCVRAKGKDAPSPEALEITDPEGDIQFGG